MLDVIESINWELVSLPTIVKLTSLEVFMKNSETKHILNEHMKKKLEASNEFAFRTNIFRRGIIKKRNSITYP
jgi:hypothetical protein